MIEARVSRPWASSPQSLGPGQSLGRQPAPRALDHPAQHLLDRHAAHELVGVGEEVALEARALDAERLEHRRVVGRAKDFLGRRQARGLEDPGQLRERGALGMQHRVLAHAAALEQAHDVDGGGVARHLVLSAP